MCFHRLLCVKIERDLLKFVNFLVIIHCLLVSSQELEVLSLNHPFSLKTKSSQCHYVVMTKSETKFQTPLNRRYQEVLAKTEHLTIKTMSTDHARHG